MFKDSKAFSSFSVDDSEKARAFYSQVLGIEVDEVPGMEGILKLHVAGGYPIMVYSKPDHVPATFTVLNFPVEDVEETVDRLIGLGVLPERYNTEDIKTDTKGIAREEDMSIAWFKDPAGNIFSVMSGKVMEFVGEMAMAGEGKKGGSK